MLIYKATNLINNKVYIGQTKNSLEQRKSQHLRDSKRMDTYFYRAINKYGWENFEWEILKDGIETQEDLNRYEKYYIKLYDSFNNKEKGYNSTSGGDAGFQITDEERKSRSERVTGEKNPMYGKSGTWTGKHFTQEHKDNLSKSLKGKQHITQQGDLHYNATSIINLSTGEIFHSIKSASEKYGVTKDAISNCLRKKTSSCCGCKWDYLENVDLGTFVPLEKDNKNFKPTTQKRYVYVKELNQVFDTLGKAAKAIGCSPSLISQRCNNPNSTSGYGIVKGYYVKYVQNDTVPSSDEE